MTAHMQMKIDKLILKNFATFEDQTVNFDNNLNTIIGETGSGKSLILEALEIILGARTDKKLVRHNCEFSIIEAIFETESTFIKQYFNELGYPFDANEITIKRIIYSNGKSKSFLNHQSCTKNILTKVSKRFVDLVGQFENQKLLSAEYQILLLDHYANSSELYSSYKQAYTELALLKNKHSDMIADNHELYQKLDYINFQINEFEKISPSTEKENELLEQKKSFLKLQEQSKSVEEINQVFEGDEATSGIFDLINKVKRILDDDMLTEELSNKLALAEDYLNDVNYALNNNSFEWDEDIDFDSILTELDTYQKLKRKYQVDTDGLQDIYNDFLQSRDEIMNYDNDLSALESEIDRLTVECEKIASKLNKVRNEFAKHLSSELTTQVRALKMNGASIKINVNETKELNSFGKNTIEFTAETNPGEGYYLIKDIASGGELSRILLALRTILSSKDSISIFLFDEIDTGIGGETALAVGQALKQVAADSQVIAISHLPQIAFFSNHLIKVSKSIIETDDSERTVSMIKEFTGDNLQTEVKAMNPLH